MLTIIPLNIEKLLRIVVLVSVDWDRVVNYGFQINCTAGKRVTD